MGDLNANRTPYLAETNIGFGLYYRNNFSDQFSLRVNANYGQISGDDANFPERASDMNAMSFTSNFFNVGGQVEWNFLGGPEKSVDYYDAGGNKISAEDLESGNHGTLYKENGTVVSGASMSKNQWVPYVSVGLGATFFNPTLVANPPLPDDYSKVSLIIPVGAGVKYYLNDSWLIGLEVMLMPSTTDFLDGASRKMDTNDWLGTIGLSVGYRL